MKILLLISLLMLSACATTGAILKGIGDGLGNGARNYQPPKMTQRTCDSQVIGNQIYTTCNQ